MKVLFTGTGTSSGVPMICCDCPVCTSSDARNKRLRASVYIEAGGQCILVDTPPDFREQCLRYRIKWIDAVLFTHSHADHVFGFDEIRRFNTLQDCVIPVYASAATMKDLLRIFDYVVDNREEGVYRPKVDFREIKGKFKIGSIEIEEFKVKHGNKQTSGFLFKGDGRRFAYVPDCLDVDDDVIKKLEGIDVMVLDALRYHSHPTHLTVEDSVEILKRIGARQSYLTHMGHSIDYAELEKTLPENILPAYDGLKVNI